jgi:hypothetical protein
LTTTIKQTKMIKSNKMELIKARVKHLIIDFNTQLITRGN